MSIVAKLTAIADALRNVLGTSGKYTLAQMPGLINSLSSNYKTTDIYCNIFKFDVAEYGESLIYNQFDYSSVYSDSRWRPDDSLRQRDIYTINKYPNSPNDSFYYIQPSRAYEHRRLRSILPNMVDYATGDTYADASGDGIDFKYCTLGFASFRPTLAKFEELKINEHFKFMYTDSEKVYSNGLCAITGYNNYDINTSNLVTTQNVYQMLGMVEISGGKLYLVNGLTSTEHTEICTVEPNVEYDVVLQLHHADTDLDENSKVINNVEYSITITDDSDTSTEYTGTITYLTQYGILHNTYTDSMKMSMYSPANRPELCHWYSFELAGKRYSNRLINPIVAHADDTLYEITDDNAPGMLTIHTNAFNPVYCTNLHRVNCTAVTTVATYAMTQLSIHNDSARSYAFHSQINEVSLPNATSIGSYAFRNISTHDFGTSSSGDTDPHIAIAKLDIHNAISIGEYAFFSALTNYFKPLILNRLSSLGQYAFSYSTITEFKSTSVQELGANAFSNSYVLEKVDLPECTTLNSSVFDSCANLRYINMPKLTSAGSSAFSGIFLYPGENGRTINLPLLSYCEAYAFYRLNLGINGELNLPELTEINGSCCFSYSTISSINLPKLSTMRSYNADTFSNIRNLKELRLPSLENVNSSSTAAGVFSSLVYKAEEFDLDVIAPNLTTYVSGMFANMRCAIFKSSKLVNPHSYTHDLFTQCYLNQIYLYNLPYLGYNAFYYATGLELVYADKLYTLGESVGSGHFYRCTHLKALILAGDEAVCTLSSTNSFSYSPIKGYFAVNIDSTDTRYKRDDGYIYVPKALLEDYKVAPNWSTFAHKFRAIEDYGGLDGIKALIYPEYTNAVTVTNADILADINNPDISTLNTANGDISASISNNLKSINLYSYTGDNTEYVVVNAPADTLSAKRSRFFIPQLPAVKDFTLEFDVVMENNGFGIIFGMKTLPTDSSELNDTYLRSPSSYLYWISSGRMYGNVRIKSSASGGISYISSTDYLDNVGYPGKNKRAVLNWNGNLCGDSSNNSSAIFYNGEKVHVKIVRDKREIRIYLNNMLAGSYVSDMVQSQPGGYFGMSTEESGEVCFGIANLTLKYNNTWTNPLATEVWISSVNWADMTSTIDGVDTVLTKNSHGYYVLDISQLTGEETTWVLSSTDGTTSTLDIANLSTYGGKIIDVYGTTVTTYN